MFNLGLGAFQQAIGTPMFDAEGQPVYQKDAEGNVIYDADGNPVQQMSGGLAGVRGYKQFYNPYVEKVIDTTQADIQRAGRYSRHWTKSTDGSFWSFWRFPSSCN